MAPSVRLEHDYVLNLILVTYQSKYLVTAVTGLLVPYERSLATAKWLRAGYGP
jgi:hypothetical protein